MEAVHKHHRFGFADGARYYLWVERMHLRGFHEQNIHTTTGSPLVRLRHLCAPERPTQRDEYPIPKGHLPPPGECRIWYPDRPPGQQPPPGNCRELRHHVPPGAYLIKG